MHKQIVIRLSPEEVNNDEIHLQRIENKLGVESNRITQHSLTSRSLDCRGKTPMFELRFDTWIDEKPKPLKEFSLQLRSVAKQRPVLIVGAGPAGLFAALRLIELGLKPVILERGKPVRARRKDVAILSKNGVLVADSNYCFGEGGAGTFSDGKLYTRATKRGSLQRILHIFVNHGATNEILVDSHPHIGTNKLPGVISSIGDSIIECGGEIHFGKRMESLAVDGNKIVGAYTHDGSFFESRSLILATGHSARDVFESLQRSGVKIEPKPFALGVRIEHPQSLINTWQYNAYAAHPNLPPAAYSLRSQAAGRGVFTFCMCPGGVICPAATAEREVVVNGWSPSKRNSKFANSGVVVEISAEDLDGYGKDQALAGLNLQRSIEARAFDAGGGGFRAPAERLDQFVDESSANSLPQTSYHPGVTPEKMSAIFPESIYTRLRQGIIEFERKRPGYISEQAVVIATESRTSSPIRIPRDKSTLMHPQISGLFPCGEGAGYAGGIVSAAMDGERVAEAVASAC